MRNVILMLFYLIVSCKPNEKEERIFGPDNKLKYIYKIKGDVKTIFDYDKKGNLMMKLKFKDDQFIDTLYFYDMDNHYVSIDSTVGQFYYGTEVLMFDEKNYGYKGSVRFRKNLDPKLSYISQRKIGKHTTYNYDGRIRKEYEYNIIKDSSFVKKVFIGDTISGQ